MMDGRVVGIHMTTAIILPPLSLLQRVLKPLPVLQHHHQHQVELAHKQQVVVTHHQHQRVVVQLQMFITLPQVTVTTPQTVQTIHLHPVRQLVQVMVVTLL